MNNLAYCYINGKGCDKKNPAQAAYFYEKSLKLNELKATLGDSSCKIIFF